MNVERGKAAVLEHQRLSGAKTRVVAGGIMAKNPRYYHTAVHKKHNPRPLHPLG